MRDINRIDKFCERLAKAWKNVPDLRFGQLMMNMLGEYYTQTRRDPFFPEDDEMIEFIEKYTKGNSPNRTREMREYVKIYCCGDCVYYNWKKHKCGRGAVEEGKATEHFYRDCPLGINVEEEYDTSGS